MYTHYNVHAVLPFARCVPCRLPPPSSLPPARPSTAPRYSGGGDVGEHVRTRFQRRRSKNLSAHFRHSHAAFRLHIIMSKNIFSSTVGIYILLIYSCSIRNINKNKFQTVLCYYFSSQ